ERKPGCVRGRLESCSGGSEPDDGTWRPPGGCVVQYKRVIPSMGTAGQEILASARGFALRKKQRSGGRDGSTRWDFLQMCRTTPHKTSWATVG
ncbi:unnamed protein product, partial [Ectocarpus fasciculatus]